MRTKRKQVTVYITADGKEFVGREEANEHNIGLFQVKAEEFLLAELPLAFGMSQKRYDKIKETSTPGELEWDILDAVKDGSLSDILDEYDNDIGLFTSHLLRMIASRNGAMIDVINRLDAMYRQFISK